MPFALAFVATIETPQQIIDSSIAAFKQRRSFAVAISMDTNYQGTKEAHTYDLIFQHPDKLLFTRLNNGSRELVFWLDAKRFIGYDPRANEKVVHPAPPKGPIVNRLANMLGGLQDVVAAQLSPSTLEGFLAPFRPLAGWTISRSGDVVNLVRAGKVSQGPTKTRLSFSATSHLMTEALLQGPGSRLFWKYNYRPAPAKLSFALPPDAKSVRALFEHIEIKRADPKAKTILESALKAYATVSNVVFTVDGPDNKSSTIWIGANSFRERQPKIDWLYSKGVLTIQTFWDGKVYKGECKPNAISSYLRILKQPMEPMLQALIVQRNPLNAWLHPSLKIRAKGVVSLNGVITDAVEMRSDFLSISLLVRRDNHLISSVTSRNLDGNGHLLSEANRTFTYRSVGKALPAGTFKLSAPKPRPLEEIK